MNIPWLERLSSRRGLLLAVAGGMASAGAVAVTRDPVTMAMWVLIWALAAGVTWCRARGVPFYLWLGAGLLYPQASDRFSSLNHYATVNGALLLAIGLSSVGALLLLVRRHLGATVVLTTWMAWGLIVYVPVLAGWGLRLTGVTDIVFPGVYAESSALKTAVPVLLAWTPAVGAVATIRSAEAARRFLTFLMMATILFAALSLLQLAVSGFQGTWVPVTYSILPNRLHSISSPDANGTARQVLPSLVLLLSVAMVGRLRVRRWLLWTAVVAAVAVMGLTVSRTALIALMAALLVVSLFQRRRRRTVLFAGGLVLSLGIGLVALGLIGVVDADRLSLDNVTGRLELYKAVWAVIAAHPIIGVRPGGYAAALVETGYPGLISPHNMWFGVAAEWGVPMALWLTAALVVTWTTTADGLRRLRGAPTDAEGGREARVLLIGASALAVTWCVHGISEIVPPESVFLALGLALAARFRLVPAVTHQTTPPNGAAAGPVE